MTGEGTFQVPTYPDPQRQNVNTLPFGFAYGEGNDLMDLGHPGAPTGLKTLSVSATAIVLDWDDKTDSNGSYNIYNGATKLGTTRNGQANLGSLTAATVYNLSVTWVDEEGNESPKSAVLPVTTSAAPAPG